MYNGTPDDVMSVIYAAFLFKALFILFWPLFGLSMPLNDVIGVPFNLLSWQQSTVCF